MVPRMASMFDSVTVPALQDALRLRWVMSTVKLVPGAARRTLMPRPVVLSSIVLV